MGRGVSMRKIAIVEDDDILRKGLCIALEKEGFVVDNYATMDEAQTIFEQLPDMILLDINLPDGNGFELANQMQQYQIPLLFLTGRDEEEDMLQAFSLGADDYVVKPFHLRVLISRINAILQRYEPITQSQCYKGLKVDYHKKRVYYHEQEIHLSAKEYQLLTYLVMNRGIILSKEQILANVWDIDGDFVNENTVAVTIKRLKAKLQQKSTEEYIHNIFGKGYCFGE